MCKMCKGGKEKWTKKEIAAPVLTAPGWQIQSAAKTRTANYGNHGFCVAGAQFTATADATVWERSIHNEMEKRSNG